MSRVSVLGLGGAGLSESAKVRLAEAELVLGGSRQLEAIETNGARRLRLGGDLGPALAAIEEACGPVVVLASGDPGFFGIVRALGERLGRRDLEVLPAPSSIAVAFARAGLAWDDALVVSAHGRDPRRAVNACRAHPKVAVLTEPRFGPAELAAALAGLERTLVVCERLGEPDERVVEGAPAEIAAAAWADPNVVLVVEEQRLIGEKGWAWPAWPTPAGWALSEEEFAHRDGMITKPEVRALALARLGPGVGELVWDVGAGSGSVAVECARFGAAAIAIEQNADDCARIRANAERHRVAVEVVAGEAPAALAGLPAPDAVFVGGGGSAETLSICAERATRVVVVALVGLERVVPAAELLAARGLEVETTLVQAARLRKTASLHRLAALNPVFLVSGVR
ncbi:MAG: precorrin-6y C5,15-methyltransferase (decarboxylating) subunit CbiE [Thermoleophilaceae bacterium]